MRKLRLLDLFSGIGGFSLGLERSGAFETVAFCEIDPFCRRVLTKHWPTVRCYDDVRELTGERLKQDGIAVDAICGGFPCQDISEAGRGEGIEGGRSGLWRELARLIGETQPAFAIVENVAALRRRGLGVVLRDLAALGYDAEWHCIPASAVGASHRRDRIWIIAYTYQRERAHWRAQSIRWREPCAEEGAGMRPILDCINRHAEFYCEPALARMVHGFPGGVDRLKALGNSLVPQIPEDIGRAIAKAVGLPHA